VFADKAERTQKRTKPYRGTLFDLLTYYGAVMRPTITIRERTWNSKGTRMLNFQLDYLDHNGRRTRESVKGHQAVPADDHTAKEELRLVAMRQAKQIRDALHVAHTTGDTRRSQATKKSVLQVVDEYLDPQYEREQTNKGHYMRCRLAKFRPSAKPLHTWTRQDSKDFVRAMARDTSETTLPGYWRAFKRAMQYALDSDLIERDPTRGIEAKGGYKSNAQERTLYTEELRRLLNTPFRDDIRGFALWSLRCGLYYKDFAKLYRSNMQELGNGKYAMRWGRQKTGNRSYCVVTEDMLRHATGEGDQLFPRMPWSDVRCNQLLKRWASDAGLIRNGKPLALSVAWLRRTYGNNARKVAPDRYVLRDMMGHISVSAAEHYVDPEPQEVLTASIKLNEYFDTLTA